MQFQRQIPNKPSVGYIDVYIDDFIGLAKGSLRRRNQICSLLFYAVDQIFLPPDALDPKKWKDPISTEKLLKGNGAWGTTKLILFWLV